MGVTKFAAGVFLGLLANLVLVESVFLTHLIFEICQQVSRALLCGRLQNFLALCGATIVAAITQLQLPMSVGFINAVTNAYTHMLIEEVPACGYWPPAAVRLRSNRYITGRLVRAGTIGTARLTGSPIRERNITAVCFPNGSGTEIAEFSLDLNREKAMMLELTENAANALKRAIDRDQGEAKGVRIALVPSGCAEFRFKLDLAPAAGDNDSVFEARGIAMFVNRTATGFIKGTRIDYVESLEGGSFIFQNPNAESTCVCGRSFTPSRDMFYAVCTAESIEPGWVKPFMLEKAGADGAEPFPILIARDNGDGYFAYVNNCPLEPHILYEGPGRSLAGVFLLCARHEAKFEMKTGLCTDGPCKGARLARIPVKVLDGEVCVSGITLMEEDEGTRRLAAV